MHLNNYWTYRDFQGHIKIGTKELRQHRYSNFYYKYAKFLNGKNAIKTGIKIRNAYWELYNPFKKADYIKQFKYTIGYHDQVLTKFQAVDLKKEIINRFSQKIESNYG